MSALMQGLLQEGRRRRRVTVLVVASCLAGAAAWMTLPVGIVLLTRGDGTGWLLGAAGIVLLALTLAAIVGARRAHRPAESLPGEANPRFGEPEPSRNPRGGYSAAGSYLGSH